MWISRICSLLLAALSFVAVGASIGCDSGPSGKPQSIASEERVQEIVRMREIFDKAKGDWNALTDEERAEYTKLAGDAAKAESMWKTMKSPMGAAPGG